MLGCFVRAVILVVLLAAGAVGWYTRDAWTPKVREKLGVAPAKVASTAWERLTPAGAARMRTALETLRRPNGPVYVNVQVGDLAAFALDSALLALATPTGGVHAIARDDRLLLRTTVKVSDLGDTKALGPLAGMLSGTQELEVRGRLEVLKPGLAQFRVDELLVQDLSLPSAVIPRLIKQIRGVPRDPLVAAYAIPVPLPREIADVRVARGRVTLYKAVP